MEIQASKIVAKYEGEFKENKFKLISAFEGFWKQKKTLIRDKMPDKGFFCLISVFCFPKILFFTT